MTDLTTATIAGPRRALPRVLPTIAIGLFGGFALGIAARAWMRLISDDPDFTWSGTIFIVLGFTVFGFTQSIAAVARHRANQRLTRAAARIAGGMGMLPLFVAAGGLMLPTVVAGSVASARLQGRRIARTICLVVAAGPVLFVGHGLVDKFGWSLHAFVGFVLMLALYGTIIRATRFTMAGPVRSSR